MCVSRASTSRFCPRRLAHYLTCLHMATCAGGAARRLMGLSMYRRRMGARLCRNCERFLARQAGFRLQHSSGFFFRWYSRRMTPPPSSTGSSTQPSPVCQAGPRPHTPPTPRRKQKHARARMHDFLTHPRTCPHGRSHAQHIHLAGAPRTPHTTAESTPRPASAPRPASHDSATARRSRQIDTALQAPGLVVIALAAYAHDALSLSLRASSAADAARGLPSTTVRNAADSEPCGRVTTQSIVLAEGPLNPQAPSVPNT